VTTGRPARPAISGIAEIPPARDPGAVSAMDFILRVARDAMVDASLTPKDIDGFLLAPTFAGAPITVSSMVADYRRDKCKRKPGEQQPRKKTLPFRSRFAG
jgi:hypothetical protein